MISIATNTKKYWTLRSADGAVVLWRKFFYNFLSEHFQVTITDAAGGFPNQIWKLVPYKPRYKILNVAQNKVVGCTQTNTPTSPIGVVSSSQTVSLTTSSLSVLT
jgi:hypothetical protein